MEWKAPVIVAIKMDAEIGSYQEDGAVPPDPIVAREDAVAVHDEDE